MQIIFLFPLQNGTTATNHFTKKPYTLFPIFRPGKNGIPVVSDSVSLRRGLLSLFDTVSHCVVTLKDKVDKNSGYYHDNTLYYQDDNYDSDELDYSGGMRRKQKLRPLGKRAHYSLKVEYPTQPGYGVNRGPQAAKGGYISRTKVSLGEKIQIWSK